MFGDWNEAHHRLFAARDHNILAALRLYDQPIKVGLRRVDGNDRHSRAAKRHFWWEKSGGVDYKGTGLRVFLNFEPGKYNKGLVSAVFAVSPALGDRRIEKLGEHSVRVDGFIANFQQTCPLKFGETFQFATG